MAQKKDCNSIRDIYNPYVENTSVSFEMNRVNTTEMWNRMNTVLKKLPWLVAEYRDQVIGYSYAADHRSREGYRYSKELSAYVADKFHHSGVGTALYYANIEILRVLGYMTVLAGITLPNPVSVRFHEKMGFQKIGVYRKVGFKLGKFLDTCWYELHIGNESKQKEIVSINTFMESDAYPQHPVKGSRFYQFARSVNLVLQEVYY